MSAVPITIQCIVYARNKTIEPFPATIIGFANITGLSPEHPIVFPPDDVQPKPPLVIWGPDDPRPTPPIHIPPELPTEPPSSAEPIHEGWNWSEDLGQWVFVYVPGKDDAQPKGGRR